MSGESTEASAVPAAVHLPDDRYIPVRTEDLLAALVRDRQTFGELAPELARVGEALVRIVDAESSALSRRMERAYAPFNPDRETVAVGDVRGDRKALTAILEYTFDKANYDHLDDAQVRAAIDSASVNGMKVRVDREKVEELQIFVRGRVQETRLVRTIRRPIVGEMREVDLFRRLAVVFRMHGSTEVSIKLFREIPVADLEALLPHAEAGMSNLDRIKILGGGIGAVGGATWKAVALLVSGSVIAGQYLWAVIAGLLGLSVRSVLGYRRAKHLRSSQRTRHLYYQNIANNAGVLDLLVASIGHEEIKETMLAYALLLAGRGQGELGRAIEAWIADRFHVTVDFDVADALESLDRLGLWEDRAALRPLPPEQACARLEALRQARATEDYHLRALERSDHGRSSSRGIPA